MKTIGAVLFPEFEMLDLYGPLEMYAMQRDAFEIRTVAQDSGPVTSSGGPETVAMDSFGDDVVYDLLLVPGGRGARDQLRNPVMLDWLGQVAGRTSLVTTVCTGSMLLAATGFLTDRRATTNKLAFDQVAALFPDVDWQPRARWVKDGTVVTSSGVSAGMDMTLAVIGEIMGASAADDAARWAEYTRVKDPTDDPFALVDEEETADG
ncbi:MAG: DJ-1/PfpI family protein [Pseudomonadota bacterium]